MTLLLLLLLPLWFVLLCSPDWLWQVAALCSSCRSAGS